MLNTILSMILIGMIPCGIIVLVFEIEGNPPVRAAFRATTLPAIVC